MGGRGGGASLGVAILPCWATSRDKQSERTVDVTDGSSGLNMGSYLTYNTRTLAVLAYGKGIPVTEVGGQRSNRPVWEFVNPQLT